MSRVFLLACLFLMLSPGIGSEYAFGTKVMPDDLDIGRPLFNTPSGTTVGYWDIGTPGYDEDDPVYLHIASFIIDMITANDVRLSRMANRSPGSKVASEDLDMNRPLTLLPATINYLNIGGGMAYDLEDPVYLHQYYCGRDCIGMQQLYTNDLCCPEHQDEEFIVSINDEFKEHLPYRGSIPIPRTSCIEFTDGYKMLVTDYIIDDIPKKAGIWRGLIVEKVRGVKADYYHVLNTWYVRIDPFESHACLPDDPELNHVTKHSHGISLICTNDVRLSVSGIDGAGSKVLDFEPDQNKMLSSEAFARFMRRGSDTTRIRYFDANGNSIYDYPDDLYINYPSGTASGIVTVNNIRLTPVNASPT